ncbi:hypothetical protein JAAARDRAFT_61977 [Jaapia argillacea MUCL 33604]|uniref:Tetrapyrrole biosynthesis uroporphyrinogen III synthase domain-containing protein n=1 Tax=Jaapia argillacea MUCL 33604 TaxID=933084 RepID=A0A067PQ53_9AGAM|nr:hypothetical protein JAAARDRAFT_61977 [Jaapia argillacea MUCL 33604]
MALPNVILLRSPSSSGPDPYESEFSTRNYHPFSVSVLETALTNLGELTAIVSDGPKSRNLVGVIITSARACEAWKSVVGTLVGNPTLDSVHETEDLDTDWTSVPFYVVGESTASSLLDIHKEYHTPLAPTDVRGGAESGTSERLAHFILEDLPTTGEGRKLLYLTGDKNRDTLPKILMDGGVTLESLQVYGTRGSSTFEHDLAAFVTPILRKRFQLSPSTESSTSTSISTLAIPRIAAIGPTTSTYLRDALHIPVHVVSPRPKAEDLAQAIDAFDHP